MNATKKILGLFVLLSSILVPVGPSTAQTPAVRDYQGIRYVSGGVGQDERDYLKSVQHQFNLGLMFAAAGGAFLSAVQITIQDARGNTVLDAVAEGPYFYAALPPGSYTVTASLDRQSQRKRVNVGAGRSARADFYWR